MLNPGAAISTPARVGPDPCFGVAGHYPDSCGTGNSSRVALYGSSGYPGRAGVGDGIAYRLRSAADVGRAAILLLGQGAVTAFSGSQRYLPFADGGLVMAAGFTQMPMGNIPANGELVLTVQVPSASLPLCAMQGMRAGAQAAILLPDDRIRFSNGAASLY